MNIDHANLINALHAIINEEINKRIEQIENSHFDIHDHRSDIEDIIQDYVNNNLNVTVELG